VFHKYEKVLTDKGLSSQEIQLIDVLSAFNQINISFVVNLAKSSNLASKEDKPFFRFAVIYPTVMAEYAFKRVVDILRKYYTDSELKVWTDVLEIQSPGSQILGGL